MSVRIGINGFGRIGRLVFRAAQGRDVEIVGLNDLTDAKTLAHLLKYDSIHGHYPGEVSAEADAIIVDGTRIPVSAERDPANLPWKSLGVHIAVESTGLFTAREKAAKHLDAGADRVIISAPAPDPDFTVVLGVNDHEYDPAKHRIVSNASCTTNCLAPVAYVLHHAIGIRQGYMTTIHAYTGDQKIVDTLHSDKRRARAASMSMIPTSTGAAKAVGLVLPELAGKLDGTAIRVPTANVSIVDLSFIAKRKTTVAEINKAIARAAGSKRLKGILTVNDAPLVSVDFNHNPASSIFDLTQTQVVDGKLCRVASWYDNEWGFSNRMVDTAVLMGKLG